MQLALAPDDVRQIAQAVVDELARRDDVDQRLPVDRIGYPEAEAAALLGVHRHVLRDCRLRGEIVARRVGNRWVYSRAVLVKWIEGQG